MDHHRHNKVELINTEIRKRNHLLWTGPALVFAGIVSYFAYFVQFPALRDFPWLNLGIILLGIVLSVVALVRAFRSGGQYEGKRLGAIGLVLSAALTFYFGYFLFAISADLPDPVRAIAVGSVAPKFALPDQDGRTVQLQDLKGKAVVLVFYRGYW